jgi:hypothetical protein
MKARGNNRTGGCGSRRKYRKKKEGRKLGRIKEAGAMEAEEYRKREGREQEEI